MHFYYTTVRLIELAYTYMLFDSLSPIVNTARCTSGQRRLAV
jgi:hypothetical protein